MFYAHIFSFTLEIIRIVCNKFQFNNRIIFFTTNFFNAAAYQGAIFYAQFKVLQEKTENLDEEKSLMDDNAVLWL